MRTDSLVVAEDSFAAGIGAAKLAYAEALADAVKEESLAAIEAFDEIQDDRSSFENTEQKESLTDDQAFGQSQNDAWHQFQGAMITAWVGLTLAQNAPGADDQYQSDIEQATDDYKTTVKTAWDELREKQAENVRERTAYYGRLGARENLALAQRQEASVNGRSSAEKALANATQSQTIALATLVGAADMAYSLTVADATLVYEGVLTTAETNLRASVKGAEITQTRALEIAALASREDTIAARGQYESNVFQLHANQLAAAATVEETSLSAYYASVAGADAAWAESLRIVRDAYQDALSISSYNYTLVVTNAESTLAAVIRSADAVYSGALSAAQHSLSIATANADANLYVASVSADAAHAAQQIIVGADYNDDVAAARTALAQRVARHCRNVCRCGGPGRKRSVPCHHRQLGTRCSRQRWVRLCRWLLWWRLQWQLLRRVGG